VIPAHSAALPTPNYGRSLFGTGQAGQALIGPWFEDSKKLTRRDLRCASSLNWVCLALFFIIVHCS